MDRRASFAPFGRTLQRWLVVAAILIPFVAHSFSTAFATTTRNDAVEPPPAGTLKAWTEGAQPLFALPDLQNETRTLENFAGKTVLVHFFATWCEPCVREMHSLQALAAAMRDRPFAIVAVDVAEVDLRVRAFFAKHPADFPVLLDRDRAVARAWQVSTLPTTFVLDADLAPRLFVEGDLDWSQPAIRSALETLSPPGARKTAALGTIRPSEAGHSSIMSTEETIR